MKHVKIIGLAAIAAMALMAFGASSASADVLCTNNTEPCTATYEGALTAKNVGGTKPILKSTSGSVEDECEVATASGTATGGAGEEVHGATKIGFEKCSVSTVVNEAAACELRAKATGSGNGTVKGVGCTVTVTIAGIGCKYGAGTGTTLGTLSEGSPAVLKVAAVVNVIDGSSFLCPATTNWNAEYEVTSPSGTLGIAKS